MPPAAKPPVASTTASAGRSRGAGRIADQDAPRCARPRRSQPTASAPRTTRPPRPPKRAGQLRVEPHARATEGGTVGISAIGAPTRSCRSSQTSPARRRGRARRAAGSSHRARRGRAAPAASAARKAALVEGARVDLAGHVGATRVAAMPGSRRGARSSAPRRGSRRARGCRPAGAGRSPSGPPGRRRGSAPAARRSAPAIEAGARKVGRGTPDRRRQQQVARAVARGSACPARAR